MSVLYLTEQYSSVRLDDETLVVKIPEEKATGRAARKNRIPLNQISHVVIYGAVTLSTAAIADLMARRIEITYLNRFGKFVARVCGDDHKHGQLRLLQSRSHDDPSAALLIASTCIRAKLHNQRTLLLRSNRTRESRAIDRAAEQIGVLINQIDALPAEAYPPPNPARPQTGTALGQLMGYEGSAASTYFQGYRQLFIDPWREIFNGRHKRPPTDPVNALLSYGYTLLTSQTVAAAQIVGFDPYVGFLHSTQYGMPALALDVVEMFRAPVVDSVVLTLLNNRILSVTDFEETLGSWRLKDPARKTFLLKFEERLNTIIIHPIFKTKVTYRRCLELQMRLLARWLQGELKRFRGFHTR